MLTGSEMAVVDGNAAALGVSRKQLMESSGNAVARGVRDLVEPGASVAVVAGRGNNGGDAFVAARFLDDYDVTVSLLGRPTTITTDIARANWAALKRGDVPTTVVTDSSELALGSPDCFVDGMLGTGISGELREPAATAARALNAADVPVLSVDVPSGLDADTGEMATHAVEADAVVTFHDTKPGLDRLDAAVTVADIGIPAAAETTVERGDLRRLTRDPDSHKGENGEILVVGGGPYTGAPALSATAALRAGADLVRVACPAAVADAIQGYSENLIVREFGGERLRPDHVEGVLDLARDQDALVLGPGLGDAPVTLEAVAGILSGFAGTAVVDADALRVVPDSETDATLLCTPHQGEYVAMGGETAADWTARRDLVASFAGDLGHALLVKGPVDVVSDGDRTRVSKTGNPGMTVGGTGDILAGVAGALAARFDVVTAGGIAAYANGRAGDAVAERYAGGLVATDLLGELPSVLWGESD